MYFIYCSIAQLNERLVYVLSSPVGISNELLVEVFKSEFSVTCDRNKRQTDSVVVVCFELA